MMMMANQSRFVLILPFMSLLLLLLSNTAVFVTAMFVDEIGVFDLTIPTTGHGPVQYAEIITTTTKKILITSDSGPSLPSGSTTSDTSCYVAGRDVLTGSILWKQKVCNTPLSGNKNQQQQQSHITLVTSNQKFVITYDVTNGIVRAWDIITGIFQWEIDLFNNVPSLTDNNRNKLLSIRNSTNQLQVSNKNGIVLTLWNNMNDQSIAINDIIAIDVMTGNILSINKVNGGGKPPAPLQPNKSISCGEVTIRSADAMKGSMIQIVPASVEGTTLYISIDQDDDRTTFSDTITSINTIRAIYLVNCDNTIVQVLITTIRGGTAFIEVDSTGRHINTVWDTEESLGYQILHSVVVDASHVPVLDTIENDDVKVTAAIPLSSSSSSITSQHPVLQLSNRFQLQYDSIRATIQSWIPGGLVVVPTDATAVTASSGKRDYTFGLIKVIVVVTPYKVLAVDTRTMSRNRDKLITRYEIPLPIIGSNNNNNNAIHKVIHGSVNSVVGTHGINGGARTRELLVLTYPKSSSDVEGGDIPSVIYYVCFDGAVGTVVRTGSVPYPPGRSILQIIPVAAAGSSSASGCRQDAIIVFDNYSYTSVLDPNQSNNVITNHLPSSTSPSGSNNGLYTHYIDTIQSKIVSLVLVPESKPQAITTTAIEIGSTSFVGETIVQVAYPNREEVISSPCNILGDESLLLKYMNPHLMVILTAAKKTTDNGIVNDSSWADAIVQERALKDPTTVKQKRKPLGVTTTDSTTTTTAATTTTEPKQDKHQTPNLFVNVIDTVSGRIIYRIGHKDVLVTDDENGTVDPATTKVVISENWIYYTYLNSRTRRTELGVISLYEGMIDRKGLSAFTSPALTTKFSSLDARESTPVALAKTYTLGTKVVTALGITTSRGGISSKRLLVATGEGQIYQIDRKALEPRRPVGPIKESEKKEGLMQYNELVSTIPFLAITYNLTIPDISTILTTPTDLESQTIVVAYGGPDIFITRISPSRGFDLLPDSFNKVLLSIVVVALIVAVVVTYQMGNKKILKHGWL